MSAEKPLYLNKDGSVVLRAVESEDRETAIRRCMDGIKWLADNNFPVTVDFDPLEELPWAGTLVIQKYGIGIEEDIISILESEHASRDTWIAFFLLMLSAEHKVLIGSRSLALAGRLFGIQEADEGAIDAAWRHIRDRIYGDDQSGR